MKAADFDYNLPEERIAQQPVEPRDAARLMVVDRADGSKTHRIFRDIKELLSPGDLLVINDTRVLPARLFGNRVPTGGRVELLLLHRRSLDTWEALVRPGRKLQPGARISFGDGRLQAEVIDRTEAGGRVVRFTWEAGSFEGLLEEYGNAPLPPYINEPLSDPGRYQTVYAQVDGAAAAPTAGLHFTPHLLDEIRAKGIHIAPVTLHVGLGTFRPLESEEVEAHAMHAEYYELPRSTAELVTRVKSEGGRVVAVGTTVVRVLESVAADGGGLRPAKGWTEIFIYPGFTFRCVDALITNFHLPRSTLLALVSAFAGRDLVMGAYEEAIREGYRFFSFGDAMFIH